MRYFSVLCLSVLLAACGKPGSTDAPEVEDHSTIPVAPPSAIKSLLARNTCLGCHKIGKRLIGPSYLEIAQRAQSKEEILELIRHPKPERWPDYPPMNPIPISDEEGNQIADWIMSLKRN